MVQNAWKFPTEKNLGQPAVLEDVSYSNDGNRIILTISPIWLPPRQVFIMPLVQYSIPVEQYSWEKTILVTHLDWHCITVERYIQIYEYPILIHRKLLVSPWNVLKKLRVCPTSARLQLVQVGKPTGHLGVLVVARLRHHMLDQKVQPRNARCFYSLKSTSVPAYNWVNQPHFQTSYYNIKKPNIMFVGSPHELGRYI
jgi:hypothetical protein